MKTKTTSVSTLLVILCISASSAAWAQTNALKAGGVDDEAVAQAYYATIDPDNLRTTLAGWKEVNGFNAASVNKIVNACGYLNVGDLGFYRSITMVQDKRRGYRGNIAFMTVNYGNSAVACAGTPQGSIVNMEYSPGPDGDRISKFSVYAPDTDADAGARRTHTAFPNSEELYVPAACFSCHGGDDDATSPISSYNDGSGETNATFLLFDVATMTFDGVSQKKLERKFKKFNKAVLRTDPTTATRSLIKGLYGGKRLPRKTQNLNFIPRSWQGEEQLYREVVIPSCRNCHTTADTKVLSLAWWKRNPGKIREEVFHELTMPNSPEAFGRFWAGNQPTILMDALDRFENP
jgi:hypothetical protein